MILYMEELFQLLQMDYRELNLQLIIDDSPRIWIIGGDSNVLLAVELNIITAAADIAGEINIYDLTNHKLIKKTHIADPHSIGTTRNAISTIVHPNSSL